MLFQYPPPTPPHRRPPPALLRKGLDTPGPSRPRPETKNPWPALSAPNSGKVIEPATGPDRTGSSFDAALIAQADDPIAPKLDAVPPPRAVLPPRSVADAQIGDDDVPGVRVGVTCDEGVQETGLGSAHGDDGACSDEERLAVDDGDFACVTN